MDLTTNSTIRQFSIAEPCIESLSEIESFLVLIIDIHQTIGFRQIVVHHTFGNSTRHIQPTEHTITIAPTHNIASESFITCNHRNASPTTNFVAILVVAHKGSNLTARLRVSSCRHMTIGAIITWSHTRIELEDIVRRVTSIRVDRKHKVRIEGISLHNNIIEVHITF